LRAGFNTAARLTIDREVARCFYMSGLAFNLVKSAQFKRMVKAIASMSTYTAPGYHDLRTKLLDQERLDVGKKVERALGDISATGSSISCDGWADAMSRPLLNILQVC
jgi:hypothetical protein